MQSNPYRKQQSLPGRCCEERGKASPEWIQGRIIVGLGMKQRILAWPRQAQQNGILCGKIIKTSVWQGWRQVNQNTSPLMLSRRNARRKTNLDLKNVSEYLEFPKNEECWIAVNYMKRGLERKLEGTATDEEKGGIRFPIVQYDGNDPARTLPAK